jgi:hypothetical protein
MLAAFFHQLDKLDRVARAGRAVAAEAAIRIGLGIDLQAGRFVRVEGAVQPVVRIRSQIIKRKYLADRKLPFYLR